MSGNNELYINNHLVELGFKTREDVLTFLKSKYKNEFSNIDNITDIGALRCHVDLYATFLRRMGSMKLEGLPSNNNIETSNLEHYVLSLVDNPIVKGSFKTQQLCDVNGDQYKYYFQFIFGALSESVDAYGKRVMRKCNFAPDCVAGSSNGMLISEERRHINGCEKIRKGFASTFHNKVAQGIVKLANQCNQLVKYEARYKKNSSDKSYRRPDVLWNPRNGQFPQAMDVTSVLPKLGNDGVYEDKEAAIVRRSKSKIRDLEKYAQNSNYDLIPMVLVGPFAVMSKVFVETMSKLNSKGSKIKERKKTKTE